MEVCLQDSVCNDVNMKLCEGKNPSATRTSAANTESLVTQRAAHRQLLKLTDQNGDTLPPGNGNLVNGDGEDEHELHDESGDVGVYDSLEMRRKGARRTTMKGASIFNESPQISVKEYYQVPRERSSKTSNDGEGFRHIIVTSPVVVASPHMPGSPSERPYHLHSDGQNSPISSTHWHNSALQPISQEIALSRSSSRRNERETSSQTGAGKKCDDAAESISGSPEPNMDVQDQQDQMEQTHGQGGSNQHSNESTLSTCNVAAKKKQEIPKDDIVERNKITLGRIKNNSHSYVMVHGLRPDVSHNGRKVTQISKGKKVQQRAHSDTPQNEQHPVQWIRAKPGDGLSSQFEGQASNHQTPSYFLNPSSNLYPVVQLEGEDGMVNMSTLHGCPPWSLADEEDFALSTGYQQSNPGEFYRRSQGGPNTQVHRPENVCEQWQRPTAMKLSLSGEEENQMRNPNDVYSEQYPQNLATPPTTTSSLASSAFTVLPPIGKPMTEKDPTHGPPSPTDSDLVRMEKQKQDRITYKAYTLKDYKQLKSDIVLRGLGPDFSAIEMSKMRRQKLYSSMIREQNKKISRISSLPAKDQKGSEKKDPRMKALEYAKTIAKPQVPCPQPRQKLKEQADTQLTPPLKAYITHAPFLEDLFLSDRLETLRRRHEEEKKAAAVVRREHNV